MTRLKIEELESPFGQVKGLEIYIGKIGPEEEWEEPMGPHPMPNVVDLREWDFKLLKRYRPMYAPMYDTCAKCTFGKCDLTAGAKGACGIDIRCNQARTGLAQAIEGCAAHSWHSRHLLSELIEKYGSETLIDMGEGVQIEAPLIRLIMGFKPKKISDLEVVIDYIEKNLTSLSSAVLPWQEGSYLDFESKQLHAGMLDLLGMEVGDIAQISAMNLAKGDPDAPLVDIGIGTIDTEKPVILCFGHNISPGASVMDYLHESSLYEEVEVGGICCSAHDITRYDSGAKVVGNLGRQLQILRSGIADVIVVDMQCIKTNMLEEAERIGARVIATTDNVCYGLRNRTKDDPDEIVSDLLKGEIGALIIDRDKIGEVAVKTAIKIAKTRPQKKKMSLDLDEMVEICTLCGLCNKECHYNLDIKKAFEEAKNGNLSSLQNLYFLCVSCGRCENVCPKEIPIVSVYTKVAQPRFSEIRSKVRSGRGPIQDVEIRNVGRPIVFGEIPGVIAFVGCPNYTPDYETGLRDQIEVAKIFLERNYIVVASGCAALDLAMYKDEDGKSLYERYPGDFDAGGLCNVGSCIANSHIADAAIKIANIFAQRPLRGNFEEIADYILNRVGAVGVTWGDFSPKAWSIATGCNRLGIPVLCGPHGVKYGRTYLGRTDRKEDWVSYNARDGSQHLVSPAPDHLLHVVESKEELIVSIAKFCIRPNDTNKGRQIKIAHYVDLHKRFFGRMPEDVLNYVRIESDIPLTLREEIHRLMEEKGWEPSEMIDPTLLKRLCRKVVK